MKYLLIGLLFLLSGCIKFSHDLGDGYILGFGINSIDRIIYIKNAEGGKGITYFEDSNKIERYFKNEEGIITSYVSQVAFDDNYIIVDQKPIDSICECNFECLQFKYGDFDDLPTAIMCEDAIKNAILHYYFIIDRKKGIIFGPMAKESLDKESRKFDIDKNLNFRYQGY